MKLLSYLWTESSDQKQASADRMPGHSPVSLTWCVHISLHVPDAALSLGIQQGARPVRCPPLGSRHSRGRCVCAKSLQSCPTICDPMDCSPPGSAVHGILQARILDWIAMPSSRGSFQPRDQSQVFRVAGTFCTIWATRLNLFLGFEI